MTKILIIEDESSIRELISNILTLHNFDPLEASNGQKGLQLAQQTLPDLILCDVMMPKMDGFEVLSHLQNQTETATIPFIFLTAKSEGKHIREGMQLGADDYLVKPFTEKDLIQSIQLRLKKRSLIKDQYQTKLDYLQAQLEQNLTHDCFTQLPNHIALREIFTQHINSCQTYQPFALLSLSLDRFHWLNQTLGYEIGDQVIKSAVQRIIDTLDDQTQLIRMNGVKFVIISQPSESLLKIVELAHNILRRFRDPFIIDFQDIFLGISIGMATYPQDGTSLENLLAKANRIRQWVESHGGNQFKAYSDIFSSQSESNHLELELALRHALEKQQLTVYYQPQFNLKTHQIVGAEALLRWKHPQKGSISPAVFIPIAESTGLIEPIGQWVLDTVCTQNVLWQEKQLENMRIAVNLSARQFNQSDLVQFLENLLEKFSLDRQCLELELTESVLMENIQQSIDKLHQIKALGIKIAIDDFGTGYSSLSYLQQLPFDILKIDQCFIRNIHQNPQNAAITETLINMARQLNLRVIAEGVETLEELAFLEQYDCDEVQGYLFSHPLSSHEIETLLNSKVTVK